MIKKRDDELNRMITKKELRDKEKGEGEEEEEGEEDKREGAEEGKKNTGRIIVVESRRK